MPINEGPFYPPVAGIPQAGIEGRQYGRRGQGEVFDKQAEMKGAENFPLMGVTVEDALAYQDKNGDSLTSIADQLRAGTLLPVDVKSARKQTF